MKTLVRSLGLILFIAAFLLNTLVPQADTFRPVVRGKRGAVAAGHPLSAEAGMRLLQQGGNAVDAGCATILAASVIEFSHFSFGGEVPIIIKTASGVPTVINGQGIAPRLATREFFLNRAKNGQQEKESPGIPSSGILPATVPAVLDAVVTALDRFGTKSLAEVIQPAIELADGFPIDELRVQYIQTRAPIFSQWPDARRIFLPNGAVPRNAIM